MVNVGKLLADGGAVGVFAGTLKHSGDIRANALTRDEAGRVVLKGRSEVTSPAAARSSASGKSGGDILIQSDGRARRAWREPWRRRQRGGEGGDIKVLGERVSIAGNGASIDASGASGGGQIRVGGDYQGANASVQNASRQTAWFEQTGLEELVLAAEDRGDGVVGEDVHDRLGEQARDGQHGQVRRARAAGRSARCR